MAALTHAIAGSHVGRLSRHAQGQVDDAPVGTESDLRARPVGAARPREALPLRVEPLLEVPVHMDRSSGLGRMPYLDLEMQPTVPPHVAGVIHQLPEALTCAAHEWSELLGQRRQLGRRCRGGVE